MQLGEFGATDKWGRQFCSKYRGQSRLVSPPPWRIRFRLVSVQTDLIISFFKFNITLALEGFHLDRQLLVVLKSILNRLQPTYRLVTNACIMA